MSDQAVALLVAQARHETNDFRSPVFKRNLNCFGMRLAFVRPRLQQGDPDSDGYANYASIAQSAEDMMLYLNYRGIVPVSASQYVNDLKRAGYFEDTVQNYLKGVNRFL